MTAAITAGASQRRIIFRHMLPSFYSHIIAASTSEPGIHGHQRNHIELLGPWTVNHLRSRYGTFYCSPHRTSKRSLLAPWLLIPGIFVVVILVLSSQLHGRWDPRRGRPLRELITNSNQMTTSTNNNRPNRRGQRRQLRAKRFCRCATS